jgi:hypothetical protein
MRVMHSEPIVEIVSLGTWATAALLAEYDCERDTIRVDANAVEAVRSALGDEEAARFVAFAVAHERFHRMHPRATEDAAHAHARAATGADARRYEAIVRARRAAARGVR